MIKQQTSGSQTWSILTVALLCPAMAMNFVAPASGQSYLIEQSAEPSLNTGPAITIIPTTQATKKLTQQNFGWQESTRHKQWMIACKISYTKNTTKDKPCRMEPVQGGVSTTPAPFQLTIERIKIPKQKTTANIVIIRTPINMLLAEGLSIKVDRARPIRVAFRSCHIDQTASNKPATGSCLVPLRLSGKILKAFKRGTALTISGNSISGKKLKSTLSLIGFTNAIGSL